MIWWVPPSYPNSPTLKTAVIRMLQDRYRAIRRLCRTIRGRWGSCLFGYLQTHEDDVERDIHTGLGVVEFVADISTGACLK